MPLPYQAIPPMIQNGVCQVTAQAGGGSDDGFVAWQLFGHWWLNQTGYAAIFTQLASYFAGRGSGYYPNNNNAMTRTSVTDVNGSYAVGNPDLQAQATLIFNILINTTTNVSGGF